MASRLQKLGAKHLRAAELVAVGLPARQIAETVGWRSPYTLYHVGRDPRFRTEVQAVSRRLRNGVLTEAVTRITASAQAPCPKCGGTPGQIPSRRAPLTATQVARLEQVVREAED